MSRRWTDPSALRVFEAWDLPVPYRQGVRCGRHVYLSGQVAFDRQDREGGVLFPDDMREQTAAAMDANAKLLAELGASLDDVVKVNAYYVGLERWRESVEVQCRYLQGARPASTGVGILTPANVGPGCMLEVEMIAIVGAPRTRSSPSEESPEGDGFAAGMRCGDTIFVSGQVATDREGRVVFPGDKLGQARHALARMGAVLDELGADLADVVKVNAYHTDTSAWEEVLDAVATFLTGGPVLTNVVVPGLTLQSALIELEAVAVVGTPRMISEPPGLSLAHGHLHHGVRVGDTIYVAGQTAVSDAGEVLHPNDAARQVRVVMENVGAVLSDLGASLDDVVKTNTFYSGVRHEWRELIRVRGEFFTEGPTVTGVAVAGQGRPDLTIQVEAVAMLDS